jgi:hypothetical protein
MAAYGMPITRPASFFSLAAARFEVVSRCRRGSGESGRRRFLEPQRLLHIHRDDTGHARLVHGHASQVLGYSATPP